MYFKDNFSNYTYISKTTLANEEILQKKLKELKPKWTSWCAKKVSINVDKDCIVKVNGDELLIRADLGFNTEPWDKDIFSLVTVTPDVNLFAVIGY